MRRLQLGIAIAVSLLITAPPAFASNSPYPTRRPHMGAQSSDVGTIYWNDLASQQYWKVYRWAQASGSSCNLVVNFYISSSVSSGLQSAAANGVRAWNNSNFCGPRFVQVSIQSQALLIVTVVSTLCGDSTSNGWIALTCRTSASSETNQTWTIGLSNLKTFGVGVNGTFDVQSVTSIETGHVIYGGHNPNWDDSIQQNNTCTWGRTSCTVTNNGTYAGFTNYTATCSNCGDRRYLLTGDWDFVRNLYGTALLAPTSCAILCSAVNAQLPTMPTPAELQAQADALLPAGNWAGVAVEPLFGE